MSALEERSGDSGSDSADPTGVDRELSTDSGHERDQNRACRKRRLSKTIALPGWQQEGEGSSLTGPPLLSAPPAFMQLTSLQRAIIQRLRGMLNTSTDSVVITNPLRPCSPIVYVTEAWQEMCGYSMTQAVGQNPRLTQGENTDKETIRGMGIALSEKRSCKVRLINYRGYNHEPFWNCLSVRCRPLSAFALAFVSPVGAMRARKRTARDQRALGSPLTSRSPAVQVHPIFHNNDLVLHIAQLQDYSHRLNRLVTHSPIQFCMADEHFQHSVPLTSVVSADHLRRPSRLEVNGRHLLTSQGEGGDEEVRLIEDAEAPVALTLPTLHVKRLGFFRIDLEPMYLVDRLKDECEQLDLPCQTSMPDGEVHRLHISSNPDDGSGHVSAALHVMPEDAFGRYCITLTRLQGDTFGYHALYRTLRQRLMDLQGGAAGAGVAGGAGGA